MATKKADGPIQKAADYLRTQIKSSTWKTGIKIPAYRILASKAGVGSISMWKAFKVLQKEKLLFCLENVGTFVGDSAPKGIHAFDPDNEGLKWEKTKERLLKDILDNKFHESGLLPSSKELLAEYNVNARTLKKSLAALVNEDIIAPVKHRYRIFPLTTKGGQTKTLFFILSSHYLSNELWSTDKEVLGEFIRSLEKECATKGIHLVTHPYGEPFPDPKQALTSLGCIIWHSQDCNNKVNYIPYLQAHCKHAAVFVQLTSESNVMFDIIKKYSKWKTCFVSDQAMDRKAGIKMGKFLFAKGYSNVLYLNHMLSSQTEEDKWKGIKDAYTSFNRPDAVTVLTLGQFTEQEIKTYTTNNDITFENSIADQLKILDTCRALTNPILNQPYNQRLNILIQEVRFARHGLSVYSPLFRKAQACTTTRTAWVCADTTIATNGAIDFLKNEKVRIAGDIGVAAFNDQFQSFFSSVTTFHLDYAGTARKMLNLIVYPEYAKKTFCLKGTNIFEVDGMVIDRGSV